MAQADIDSYNRDAEELVAYLLSHGVVASLTADRHGIATASCDETEAAWAAVDEFYGIDGYCGAEATGFAVTGE